MGSSITFVDQFVDDLLVKERVCATSLWKMPQREVLEDLEVLEPRISPLGDIEDLLESDVEEVDGDGSPRGQSPGSKFGEEGSPERESAREGEKEGERGGEPADEAMDVDARENGEV